MPDLESLSSGAAYALLAALVFAESGLLLGFFLPGDTVLFAAGLLSGAGGPLSLELLLAVVLPAAVLGDLVGYATGRKAGPVAFRREGRVLNATTLARAELLYARHGALAVVACRWIPWVRTFVPILAGTAAMPLRLFVVADIVGALLWGGGLLVLGHVAAATPGVGRAAVGVALTVVVGSVVAGGVAALRARRVR